MGFGVFFYVNAYQYAVVPNLQRKKNTTTSRRLEDMFHHRVLWNYVMLAITRDRAFLKPGGCYRSMDGISAETNCSVNNTAMKEVRKGTVRSFDFMQCFHCEMTSLKLENC